MMIKRKALILVAVLALAVFAVAQDKVSRAGASVAVNADGSVTVTLKSGKTLKLVPQASLPVPCSDGQLSFKTGVGLNQCVDAAWVDLAAGGGGGGVSNSAGAHVVPLTNGGGNLVGSNIRDTGTVLNVGRKSSVIVAGAGSSAVNGKYTYRGSLGAIGESHSLYVLEGQSDGSDQKIFAVDGGFQIYGAAGEVFYHADGPIAFPWQGTYGADGGDEPSPTLTEATDSTDNLIAAATTRTLIDSPDGYIGDLIRNGLSISWRAPDGSTIFEPSILIDSKNGTTQIGDMSQAATGAYISVYGGNGEITLSAPYIKINSVPKLNPLTFATLPASPEFGMIACISDSDTDEWGEVVTGGGAIPGLVFYNGTNWTFYAK